MLEVSLPKNLALLAGGLALCGVAASADAARSDWAPTKGIEFIATSSPGGGTDRFTRTIQAAIQNNKLIDQNITVIYKGGANGAEGLVVLKKAAGDPHKIAFATSNVWMLPLGAKMAYKRTDLTPLAALAIDEFVIWVNADRPYKTIAEYIEAAKASPKKIRMGGGKSKDTDHVLTRLIQSVADVTLTYVPFKGGSAAAVQLAGGHIDSNTNNPAENLAQWGAGKVRPLCVTSPERMTDTGPVANGKSWADIPTCAESGLAIKNYRQPRTLWLAGNVGKEQVEFWQGVLAKVRETPEWKAYIKSSALSDAFIVGAELDAFIDEAETVGKRIFKEEGWLVGQ